MADFNRDAVRVAQTGRIFYAPASDAGAILPATWDANTVWPAPWKSLGLFNEDGVTHEMSDDTEEIVSWQKDLVRIVTTARELTLQVVGLESSVAVIEMFYDSTFELDGTTARLAIPHATPRSEYKFGFEWQDNGSPWRLLLPVASVSEVESPEFNKSGAVTWGMTLRALASDSDYLAEWSTNDPRIVAELSGS